MFLISSQLMLVWKTANILQSYTFWLHHLNKYHWRYYKIDYKWSLSKDISHISNYTTFKNALDGLKLFYNIRHYLIYDTENLLIPHTRTIFMKEKSLIAVFFCKKTKQNLIQVKSYFFVTCINNIYRMSWCNLVIKAITTINKY